jgi:hypothetical protein
MMLVEINPIIATPLRGRRQFAWHFFIFVWVARIFDQHSNRIMVAERLRARSDPVKSRRRVVMV